MSSPVFGLLTPFSGLPIRISSLLSDFCRLHFAVSLFSLPSPVSRLQSPSAHNSQLATLNPQPPSLAQPLVYRLTSVVWRFHPSSFFNIRAFRVFSSFKKLITATHNSHPATSQLTPAFLLPFAVSCLTSHVCPLPTLLTSKNQPSGLLVQRLPP